MSAHDFFIFSTKITKYIVRNLDFNIQSKILLFLNCKCLKVALQDKGIVEFLESIFPVNKASKKQAVELFLSLEACKR